MANGPAQREVVIIGGGFGGLACARELGNSDWNVTLVDRRNFHLFQPLLYQVATGALSPANIAAPLRSILKRYSNIRVVLGEVTGFDLNQRQVILADGERLPFAHVVVASGSTHHYFGHDEWSDVAPGLKTIEDATTIRARILGAFEQAERTDDVEERRRLMTFVVAGAGPTGVEMAGAISELARHTLRRDFRVINPASARIILAEGAPRVLPPFSESLSRKAAAALAKMGVELWVGAKVVAIHPGEVTIVKEGREEKINAANVIWAAGVKASHLGQCLVESLGTGMTLSRGGTVPVGPTLTVAGRDDIHVIGDLASAKDKEGKPLPGVAPVAMQQGGYVAKRLRKLARGTRASEPFRYHDRGSMATIGRGRAVADAFGFQFNGMLAWLAWLFIHIMYLARFENRVLVLIQWFWNYISRNRAARLITEPKTDIPASVAKIVPAAAVTPTPP